MKRLIKNMDIEHRQITAMLMGGCGDLILRLITNNSMFGYLGVSLMMTGLSLLLLKSLKKTKTFK